MSEVFKVTSGDYIRRAMSAWMTRRGWLLLLPAIVMLPGVIIMPMLFVAVLMWVLLIAPVVLAFVYLYYGLSDYAVSELLEHRIEFSDNTLRQIFIDNKRPEFIIEFDDIKTADIGSRKITIYLKNNPYHIIIIPREALSEQEDAELLRWLQPLMQSVD